MGGNGSATTFVLTGTTKGFNYVISLKERYIKEEIDPDQLNKMFLEFVLECLIEYRNITEIRCDSAEQVLIRGLKNALIKKGIAIPVRNAIKGEILERIRFNQFMFAVNRYFILDTCPKLIDAFENAIWKEDGDDERLDDGTTNIDSLDAEEYSIEKYIPIITKIPR